MSLHDCELETYVGDAAEGWLEWVLEERLPDAAHSDRTSSTDRDPKLDGTGLRWLLAHCDDGVVWGRRDQGEASWLLSSAVAPALSPRIRRESLQQLRLFGEHAEVLLWRTEGGLRGRRLSDSAHQGPDPTQPATRQRVLVGNRRIEAFSEGFTRVRDVDGREQVVPVKCEEDDFDEGYRPLRLELRHYFESDPETGATRAAASRLVRIYLKPKSSNGGRS